MELKSFRGIAITYHNVALIVPYGIEMEEYYACATYNGKALIVPYGIEII